MKNKIILFLVLMVLFSFIPADFSNAEEQDQEGLLSSTDGNEYLEFEEYEKWVYVRGMTDAIYATLRAFRPEIYQKYKETTKDMVVSQLTKILDKYLEENPEKLHYAVANSFIRALSEIVYK
jgi:hypothetical protein